MDSDYQTLTQCEKPLAWMGRTCGTHVTRAPIRCWKCEPCQLAYYYQKRAEIRDRFDQVSLLDKVSAVYMWTVGSNLHVDDPKSLDTFNLMWKKFNSRLQKHIPYQMYFRVFEAGSKGNYLHAHFITSTWMKHSCTYWSKKPEIQLISVPTACKTKCVMCIWRLISEEFTGELNANVHVSDPAKSLKKINKARLEAGLKPYKSLRPKYALMYLVKYMTKAKFGEAPYVPRAYYIGKPMWERYTFHTTENKLYSRVDVVYKGHLSGYKKLRYRGTHLLETVRWKDRNITCMKTDCDDFLIVKAFKFELRRDPKRIRILLDKNIQEQLMEIDTTISFQPSDVSYCENCGYYEERKSHHYCQKIEDLVSYHLPYWKDLKKQNYIVNRE